MKKTNNKVVSLQACKDLFSKIAIIAQKKSVNLRTVFQYPLRPLPWAISNSMGTLKKTTKSLLVHKLAKMSECILSVKFLRRETEEHEEIYHCNKFC